MKRCLVLIFMLLLISSLTIASDPVEIPELPELTEEFTADKLPSDRDIDKVYENAPEIIYEMVRKVITLETVLPQLFMPDLLVMELQDGSVRAYFEDTADVIFGSGEYLITGSWHLDQLSAVYARRECPEMPWGWIIVSDVVSFALGVLAGGLAFR